MANESIWYWAAAGMGFAVGNKLTGAVLRATGSFLQAALHAAAGHICPCPLCDERAPCGTELDCQCEAPACQAGRREKRQREARERAELEREIASGRSVLEELDRRAPPGPG